MQDELLEEIQKALDEDEKAAKPKELKQTMIFAIPLLSKNSSEVEQAVKELILYIERALKHKVDRVHSDPGTEVSTKRFKEWCTSMQIRRTTTTPEDSDPMKARRRLLVS